VDRKPIYTALLTIVIVLAGTTLLAAYGQSGVEYTWSRYRPLIGGIRVTSRVRYTNSSGVVEEIGQSTLSYAVRRNSDNQLGVIIAGHVIYDVPGNLSYALIYQPNWTSLDYVNNITLGNVNITGDFAFVPYQNVSPQLLYITQDNYTRPIKLYINTTVRWNQLTETFVYKTGQSTGTTSGYIVYGYRFCLIESNVTGKTYIHTYCIITNVPASFGDSGAPLFKFGAGRDGRPWVGLYGHNLGGNPNMSIFISVEAVYQSNFTPLTVG
jgi:hypothetical protein